MTIAILLLVVAGSMNASFSVPMKWMKGWDWENTWSVWSFWALLVMPLIAAWLTIPHLARVYSSAGTRTVLLVVVCGLLWGIAQVMFGLSIDAIGIALTFAIVLGLSAAIGSLLPFMQLHRERLATRQGAWLFAGVVLVVAGVAICALAGYRRDCARDRGIDSRRRTPIGVGLAFAVLSGIGTAAMNCGIAYAGAILRAAEASGAASASVVNAVWLPLMSAAAIPNIVYCLHLMRKKRSGEKFWASDTWEYWGFTFVMALFWFGSNLLYGAAIGRMGDLGAILGWPFFVSLIVIAASVFGVLTGEWKGSGVALRIQCAGVAVLVMAVVVLSRAGQFS